MKQCFKLKSIEEYLEINDAYHKKSGDAVPNKFLKETLKQVNNQRLRYHYDRSKAFRNDAEVMKKALSEHLEILETLNKKWKQKEVRDFSSKTLEY